MVDSLPSFEEIFKDSPQIRVLTNLDSSRKFSVDAHEKAKKILKELNIIKRSFQKENAPWARQMANRLGWHISDCSIKEWFSGRSSVPLHFIGSLVRISDKGIIENISKNCDYFSTKTSNPARLPKIVLPELAWLVAAILCDGHIGRNWRGVVFEVGDLTLAQNFSRAFSIVFESKLKLPITVERPDKNKTYVVCIHNAPAELFLNKAFQIPFGYKCDKIVVPMQIKEASVEVKRAFLKGVFDTDGGKRGRGLGLTTLSERFRDDVSELLKEFNINSHSEFWVNKKYNKKYYGLRFKVDGNSIFLSRQ